MESKTQTKHAMTSELPEGRGPARTTVPARKGTKGEDERRPRKRHAKTRGKGTNREIWEKIERDVESKCGLCSLRQTAGATRGVFVVGGDVKQHSLLCGACVFLSVWGSLPREDVRI